MRQTQERTARTRLSNAESGCIRAHKVWEHGNLSAAFCLMLDAAKMGDITAQVDVGYMYNTGVGVERDRNAALYWYKRAYRRGAACAAHNIGTVWRDDQHPKRAAFWFQRAVELNGGDDGDATFEIAKLYAQDTQHMRRAVHLLRRVLESRNVTQNTVERARGMLKRLSSRANC